MAKFLHWLMAAIILTQFTLGWLAASWRLSPTKLDLFVWHKSTGMLILALALARILWRVTRRVPALPSAPAWERAAAAASHALLYLLMIVMPITGWVVNSAAGVPFRIFWWLPLTPLGGPDKHTESIAALTHSLLAAAFAMLIAVHIGAALRHHFVKRDDVLKRMLPIGMTRSTEE